MTLAVVAAVASGGMFSPASATAGRVEIVNTATQLRADVMWGSVQDGQNVFLWPNNPNASQEYDLIAMGSGFFQIRAAHSGKCLMVDRTQPFYWDGGTRIAQYPCTGASYKSAQWSFKPMNCEVNTLALCIERGQRIIQNRYTAGYARHWCLDSTNPYGRMPRQMAVLQLWPCISSPSAWNADNQIWTITTPR